VNIKQHIEAGHYPKTDEGMEIVQTSEGLTVHVADVHPDGRIAGWLSKGDPSAYTWNRDGGAFQEHGGDLLPPAPRKLTRYLGIHPGCPAGYATEAELREKMAQYTGWVVGKIEYEENW
jgi:hypothetical protein